LQPDPYADIHIDSLTQLNQLRGGESSRNLHSVMIAMTAPGLAQPVIQVNCIAHRSGRSDAKHLSLSGDELAAVAVGFSR
jgi:hypothetical protein